MVRKIRRFRQRYSEAFNNLNIFGTGDNVADSQRHDAEGNLDNPEDSQLVHNDIQDMNSIVINMSEEDSEQDSESNNEQDSESNNEQDSEPDNEQNSEEASQEEIKDNSKNYSFSSIV